MESVRLDSACGVTLVPVATAHAAMLAELVRQDNDHLSAWLPMLGTLGSVEAAEAHLAAATARAAEGDVFEWHLFIGDTLCGAVRLKDIDHGDRKAGIGYFVGSRFAGKGIAGSAVQAVLAWGFGPLGLNRVELRCAAGNERSARVAERLGFVREGLLRQDECLHGAFVDHYVYGLLKTEFAA